MKRTSLSMAILALLVVGCAQGPQTGRTGTAQEASNQPARTLVMAIRFEPNSVAARPLVPQAIASYLSRRIFNADLALLDGDGNPRPYLAEALPALNTDTWRVFPDGRMETTYRLKPDLTWHNGSPLTSADFAFAYRIYSAPELGGTTPPFGLVEEVATPDARTIQIRWKRPFADAGALQSTSPLSAPFPPLPRAILEPIYETEPIEALVSHPIWTQSYVGLGPYRLAQWEPGAFYVATAFDRHVLGAPKIERLRVLFMSDGNSVLASMLAGEVHFAADLGLQVSHVPLLLNQWGPGRGTAIQHPNQWRVIYVQLRPDYASPRVLLDPRVRKALAHAIDKAAIVEAVYEGQAPVSDIMIAPTSDVGRAIDAVITKYPLDLRRSADLMTNAGFARGPDGAWMSPAEGRLATEIKTNAGVNFEAEMSILANGWAQAGFNVREVVVPAGQAQDPEIRGAYPGLFAANTNVGEGTATMFTTAGIPWPYNRWTGSNRSGYSNPQYDQLADAFSMALQRSERARLLVEITRLFSEDVPGIALSFQPQPWVHIAEVRGPKLASSDSNMSWNIYEWEFR